MLQSFLQKNKASLANLNLQPLMPSQHQFKKPCCNFLGIKDNKSQENQRLVPKSPTYTRRKIFQPTKQLQSQATAGFKQIDLTQSTVQTYRAPVVQQKAQEAAILVKIKARMSKQNGLVLANGKLDVKQSPRSTLQTISSQNQIPFKALQIKTRNCSNNLDEFDANKQNKRLKGIHQNEQSQCSLSVREGEFDLFTFNSEGSITFEYSPSKNTNSSKFESVLKANSPRDSKKAQIKGFI